LYDEKGLELFEEITALPEHSSAEVDYKFALKSACRTA
jgi:uncharacterized SAM-dependent methyltransferase